MTEYRDTTTTMWVRPNDLDSLGHVNNATALEYLENGRWDWLARNGVQRTGGPVIAVVARAEIDYRRVIASRRVHVHTHLESAPSPGELGYRVVFRQRIDIAEDEPLPRGAPPEHREAVSARIEVGFYHAEEARLAAVDEFFGE